MFRIVKSVETEIKAVICRGLEAGRWVRGFGRTRVPAEGRDYLHSEYSWSHDTEGAGALKPISKWYLAWYQFLRVKIKTGNTLFEEVV